MTQPTDTDKRLTELEIKASFAEDLIESLNQVVIRQQQQIDRLVLEVTQLRRQLEQSDTGAAPLRSLRDELPPHY
ncbi:MAG: SlyX protein [Aquabacterium sp.]|jgi:SlyX protein|nr:MAG: SlyX protein [Aquabacterium sp.]